MRTLVVKMSRGGVLVSERVGVDIRTLAVVVATAISVNRAEIRSGVEVGPLSASKVAATAVSTALAVACRFAVEVVVGVLISCGSIRSCG